MTATAAPIECELVRLMARARTVARIAPSDASPLSALADLLTILTCEREIAQRQAAEWEQRALCAQRAAVEAERKLEQISEVLGGGK